MKDWSVLVLPHLKIGIECEKQPFTSMGVPWLENWHLCISYGSETPLLGTCSTEIDVYDYKKI